MLSKRNKRPVPRTRLRFGRREPQRVPRPFVLAPRQTFDTMDLSEYDEDLIEMKRRAEADGVYVQIPKRGAVWKEPTPLRLNGISPSDVIIQLRHGTA
jgi:hypothetical protein